MNQQLLDLDGSQDDKRARYERAKAFTKQQVHEAGPDRVGAGNVRPDGSRERGATRKTASPCPPPNQIKEFDLNNKKSLFGTVDILVGDCIESIKTLPEKSVSTCITSPPYFGLRDYGVDGQIGLEETPDAYVQRLVDVFREVRRVLSDDGTLWLNLGDSYATHASGSKNHSHNFQSPEVAAKNGIGTINKPTAVSIGLKEKDIIGIPWRVAFALQADGWYLRQDIIWHKPNPMPESVTDRCTKAHEYIFLLSKSKNYYYDYEAIKEPIAESTKKFGGGKKGWGKSNINHATPQGTHGPSLRGEGRCGESSDGTRNKRSVWTVATKPYSGAHFATFPPDLIEPCVLAGSPENGIVLDPFGGSGTTAGVAVRTGRRAILCELNSDYVDIMDNRIAEIVYDIRIEEPVEDQLDLFEVTP